MDRWGTSGADIFQVIAISQLNSHMNLEFVSGMISAYELVGNCPTILMISDSLSPMTACLVSTNIYPAQPGYLPALPLLQSTIYLLY